MTNPCTVGSTELRAVARTVDAFIIYFSTSTELDSYQEIISSCLNP